MKRTPFLFLAALGLLVHCDAQLADGPPCHALSRVWCDHLDSCGVLAPTGDAAGCLDALQSSCSAADTGASASPGTQNGSSATSISDVRACLDAIDPLACGAPLPGECSGMRSQLHCDTAQGVSYCNYVVNDGIQTPGAYRAQGGAGQGGAGPGGAGAGGSAPANTPAILAACDAYATWVSKCAKKSTYAASNASCLDSSQGSMIAAQPSLLSCYSNAKNGLCASICSP